jgi:antitoxin MazE
MNSEIIISRWDFKIPDDIIKALNINIGDKVHIFVENNRAIIEPIVKSLPKLSKKRKVYTIDELIANIPKDYKKEDEQLDIAMGREIW